MNIFQLIQLVIQMLGKTLPLPEFKDAEATEAWLQDLSGPIATIIAMIARQLDDRVGDVPLMTVDEIKAAVDEAVYENDPKIDPAVIIAIITAVIKLIELWRNRRVDPAPGPGPDVI